MILPPSFYTRTDVVQIARELLGKVLVTNIEGRRTEGMIVETEAYAGPTDKACHAFCNRRTRRTNIMFEEGGVAYVYLCYGIHHLLNVVTNVKDAPYAVLIRGIEPLDGVDAMLIRRGATALKPALTAGPGSLSAAMGITTALSGVSLQGPEISIEDRGIKVADDDILAGTRVGVAYAAEDALLPYRFSIKGNRYVSKGKGL
jgi:DNA-3-methyladenine glycosylase